MTFQGLLFTLERKPVKYSLSQKNIMSNYVSENEQPNQGLDRTCPFFRLSFPLRLKREFQLYTTEIYYLVLVGKIPSHCTGTGERVFLGADVCV